MSSADCQQSNSFQMDRVPRCARWMHRLPNLARRGGKATESRVRSPQSQQQQQTSITGIRLFPAGISESSDSVGCPAAPGFVLGLASQSLQWFHGLGLGLGLAWASYLGSLQIRWCPRNISVDRHARTSEGTVCIGSVAVPGFCLGIHAVTGRMDGRAGIRIMSDP